MLLFINTNYAQLLHFYILMYHKLLNSKEICRMFTKNIIDVNEMNNSRKRFSILEFRFAIYIFQSPFGNPFSVVTTKDESKTVNLGHF